MFQSGGALIFGYILIYPFCLKVSNLKGKLEVFHHRDNIVHHADHRRRGHLAGAPCRRHCNAAHRSIRLERRVGRLEGRPKRCDGRTEPQRWLDGRHVGRAGRRHRCATCRLSTRRVFFIVFTQIEINAISVLFAATFALDQEQLPTGAGVQAPPTVLNSITLLGQLQSLCCSGFKHTWTAKTRAACYHWREDSVGLHPLT